MYNLKSKKKICIKKYSSIIICFILCCILIRNSVTFTAPHILSKTTFASSDKEIVLLWTSDTKTETRHQILQSLHTPITVLEESGVFMLCQIEDSTLLPSIIDSLKTRHEIAAAEPNHELDLLNITSDPYSDTQWPLKNNGSYLHIIGKDKGTTLSIPDVDLDITDSWEIYPIRKQDTKEVIVAIIDTGVDVLHPDLKGNIWINPNESPNDGIDNDVNGYIDDIYGWDFYNNDNTVCHYLYNNKLGLYLANPNDDDNHGTHCAGIIAASAGNGIGIAGIASNVNIKIMPLKIHGGKDGKGTIASAIKAVKYAVENGADICNMSWGSSIYSEALELIMRESDILFVAAAGNSGSNNMEIPIYPASFKLDNLISVAFIDANGILPYESNYGLDSVDIAAPGVDIFSTIVGSYQTMGGSSMAAPHVSAVAAMLYAYQEGLYPSEIRHHLLSNLKPLTHLKGHVRYPGIPSAFLAISSLDKLLPDHTAPSLTLSTGYDKENIIVTLNPFDALSGVRTLKYSPGNKDLSFFHHGISGLSVNYNTLNLAKSGFYTFYISDYAGNETLVSYEVEEDTIPPVIKADYVVSSDHQNITITSKILDFESGIKTVKYLPGRKSTKDFLAFNTGTVLELKQDKVSFSVKNPGVYTIYAVDYRGNKSLYYVNAAIIKADSVDFDRLKKQLGVGTSYSMPVHIFPSDSTDLLTYKSSNPSVASISKTGLITGKKPGIALITVTTTSGKSSSCLITVK